MTSDLREDNQCCIVCGGALRGLRDWLWRCEDCGFLQSSLKSSVEDPELQLEIDETARADALIGLRKRNFESILGELERHGAVRQGAQLLDVGCAHGWFLDVAATRPLRLLGIEPDPHMARLAGSRHEVIRGYFPSGTPVDAKFDIITFNDVFEHLPDVHEAMTGIKQKLKPGGFLVLNIPTSEGIFYRVSAALDSVGIRAPFHRMWQLNFASPHISYFTADHLARLAGNYGLVEVGRTTLPSVDSKNLWQRLRYDRNSSAITAAFVWVVLRLLHPVLKLLPADINLQIFKNGHAISRSR